MQIVEVVWDDAHASLEYITVKEAAKAKAKLTRSVGYLVNENDRGVTIATDTYDDEKDCAAGHHFIPWEVVVSYEELVK